MGISVIESSNLCVLFAPWRHCEKQMPQLLIKKSQLPDSGKGLFTLDDIPKGGRICEYSGRRRKWVEVKHLDGHNGYLLRLNRTTAIDAKSLNSGKGRYANDAAGLSRIPGLKNNAEYLIYGDRVFIEATRRIQAGEEILVSYGKDFWRLQRNLKIWEFGNGSGFVGGTSK